jgi:hypothetical protein
LRPPPIDLVAPRGSHRRPLWDCPSDMTAAPAPHARQKTASSPQMLYPGKRHPVLRSPRGCSAVRREAWPAADWSGGNPSPVDTASYSPCPESRSGRIEKGLRGNQAVTARKVSGTFFRLGTFFPTQGGPAHHPGRAGYPGRVHPGLWAPHLRRRRPASHAPVGVVQRARRWGGLGADNSPWKKRTL